MKKRPRANKILDVLFSVLALAVLLAAWLIACAQIGNDYILPSFSDTMVQLWALFGEVFFWQALGSTLLRAAEGWALSFLCAAAAAVPAAMSKKFSRFIGVFVLVLRVIPTLAVTLMLLLWSTPHQAPVIVVFLMLFPISYAQLSAALRGIDAQLAEMAQVYGVSLRDRIFRIYIPQMLPALFAQAGANLSLALKVAVSAEVLAYTYVSIGGMMQTANSFLEIARMFALTISIIVLGGLLEFALGFLTRITDRWKGGRAA